MTVFSKHIENDYRLRQVFCNDCKTDSYFLGQPPFSCSHLLLVVGNICIIISSCDIIMELRFPRSSLQDGGRRMSVFKLQHELLCSVSVSSKRSLFI